MKGMAKASGGTRNYRPDTSAYQKRLAEVEGMRSSGKYSSVEMFDGGGYLAIEKSTAKHKQDEITRRAYLQARDIKSS